MKETAELIRELIKKSAETDDPMVAEAYANAALKAASALSTLITILGTK